MHDFPPPVPAPLPVPSALRDAVAPGAAADACPACGSSELTSFYHVTGVPVHSVLLVRTRREALDFPTGDIDLAVCGACGFITNTAFDPSLQNYSAEYEETQGFSGTFNSFHRRLAEDLIRRHDVRGRSVIEIGCGKGEFISMLCELGDNRGIGFDPAYVPQRNTSPVKDRVRFVRDFYSETYAHHRADVVCCKMTMEHIPDVARLVGTVRRSIGTRPDVLTFFQVPETGRILHDRAFWDVYYEHCSYFTPTSIAALFRAQGFDVLDVWTDYDDQYLMIEARPGTASTAPPPREEIDALLSDVSAFRDDVRRRRAAWTRWLARRHRDGRSVALWGGGSKAVAFLTTLGLREEVSAAVDINPYKHDTFLAGTGHPIVAPSTLPALRPDTVVVMNPIYRDEIRRDLHALGLDPVLVDVDAAPEDLPS